MQLDQTAIVIRERAFPEILDLALRVTRMLFLPLLGTLALGVAPLMLLNWWLVGWMAELEMRETFPLRYEWCMALLVYLEAPLASVFASVWIGEAMFQQRPGWRGVLRSVAAAWRSLLVCHVLLRGIGLAWLCLALLPAYSELSPIDLLLLPMLALYALVFRTLRPFINEIVLLEKNPLIATAEKPMSVRRRSDALHGPSIAELLIQACLGLLVGLLLTAAVVIGSSYLVVMLFNTETSSPLITLVVYPLALWAVAGFFTVVRFLSYLDLRIRREGWEVELLIRAEARRLAESPL